MKNTTSTRDQLDALIRNESNGGDYGTVATDAVHTEAAADAILAEFVVVPRAGLPEVVKGEDGWLDVGGVAFSNPDTADDSRRRGMRMLALAEYLEAQEHANACARAARRDELARELTAEQWDEVKLDYSTLGAFAQRAIDRIIELEEAAA